LKNPVAVIDCDCFQTFAEKENFFGKDTGKLFVKTLPGVLDLLGLIQNS
jgi:hypothetical protein